MIEKKESLLSKVIVEDSFIYQLIDELHQDVLNVHSGRLKVKDFRTMLEEKYSPMVERFKSAWVQEIAEQEYKTNEAMKKILSLMGVIKMKSGAPEPGSYNLIAKVEGWCAEYGHPTISDVTLTDVDMERLSNPQHSYLQNLEAICPQHSIKKVIPTGVCLQLILPEKHIEVPKSKRGFNGKRFKFVHGSFRVKKSLASKVGNCLLAGQTDYCVTDMNGFKFVFDESTEDLYNPHRRGKYPTVFEYVTHLFENKMAGRIVGKPEHQKLGKGTDIYEAIHSNLNVGAYFNDKMIEVQLLHPDWYFVEERGPYAKHLKYKKDNAKQLMKRIKGKTYGFELFKLLYSMFSLRPDNADAEAELSQLRYWSEKKYK